ncbi:MAG: HEAT repeat domain-containing protein [Capsulimonadaceae bacterium]
MSSILDVVQKWQIGFQVDRRTSALRDSLQNHPLRRLVERSSGKAIENSIVSRLEEQAANEVIAHIQALAAIAAGTGLQSDVQTLFRQALPVLGDALAFQGGEWAVRDAAIKALGIIWGDDQVVPLLVGMLEDAAAPLVARAAAAQLAEIGTPGAADALVNALASPDHDVRALAGAYLSHKNSRSTAIGALRAGTTHRNPVVRRSAARLLDTTGWVAGSVEERAWHAVAAQDWLRATEMGVAAEPPLWNAIVGKDSAVRAAAAEVIERIGRTPASHAALAKLLVARQDWGGAAAMKLVAAPALTNALEADSPEVSTAACEALLSMGPDAVPALVDVIENSRDPYALRRACDILADGCRRFERGRDDAGRRDPAYPRRRSPYLQAISPLMDLTCDTRGNATIEAADALASIAEACSEGTTEQFARPLEMLRSQVQGQNPMVRRALEVCRERIERAVGGRGRRSLLADRNILAVSKV